MTNSHSRFSSPFRLPPDNSNFVLSLFLYFFLSFFLSAPLRSDPLRFARSPGGGWSTISKSTPPQIQRTSSSKAESNLFPPSASITKSLPAAKSSSREKAGQEGSLKRPKGEVAKQNLPEFGAVPGAVAKQSQPGLLLPIFVAASSGAAVAVMVMMVMNNRKK